MKRPEREADHWPPSSAEDEWGYTSTLLICLHGVGRDNFAFFLPLSFFIKQRNVRLKEMFME
jgi:hypothetical protein